MTSGTSARPRISEEEERAAQLELGTTRRIAALGPGGGAEDLRAAYLDLLKLCLCDLAGASTYSVTRAGDGRNSESQVFSRELGRDELTLRAEGKDWPLSGLSMIGLRRLDDLQSCVESIVSDHIEGDLVEAGAWRGGASILMRATLDSLGARARTVVVADSFRGLPVPDEAFPEDHELDLSSIDFLAVPLEDVRGYFERFGCERGVEFVPGFFEETLPTLADHTWSVVRLDGDTYESTSLALEALYPRLVPGGYLIVDDYLLIDECRAAVDEFRRAYAIAEPIEEIDRNGIKWRRRSSEPSTASTRRSTLRPRNRPRRVQSAERRAEASIPTERELDLVRQIEERRLGKRITTAVTRLRRVPKAIARRMRRDRG